MSEEALQEKSFGKTRAICKQQKIKCPGIWGLTELENPRTALDPRQ